MAKGQLRSNREKKKPKADKNKKKAAQAVSPFALVRRTGSTPTAWTSKSGAGRGALITGVVSNQRSAVNFAKYDVERADYRGDIREHVASGQEIHCRQMRK
jgi:hypothetical protein